MSENVSTITIARPYRLWDFCGCGNSEPNDTLKEVKCTVNQQHNDGKPQYPHLFPKEARKFERAAAATAKA